MAMIEVTDELYKACRGTIEKACRDAYRKNPVIDLDDYRSYADEVFMDAALSYDPNSGTKFNTWLTTQLLRLKKYASRGGKMIVDHKGVPDSIVGSLDRETGSLDGRQCSLHDMKLPTSDSYLKELTAPNWDYDWWKRMDGLRPYFAELSDDARMMVDDILDGTTGRTASDGTPMLERGNMMYARLTPRQLYLRLYCRRGWEFERVRDARIEIEEMLRKWCVLPLPEMDKEMRTCNLTVRTVRDGSVVSKKSVRWDRFKHVAEESIAETLDEVKVQDELF